MPVILSFFNTRDLHLLLYKKTLPSVALFFDWRWIKNTPKRLKIKMYSFLKAFLVLMKQLSKRLQYVVCIVFIGCDFHYKAT